MTNSSVSATHDENSNTSSNTTENNNSVGRILRGTVLFTAIALGCFVLLNNSVNRLSFHPISYYASSYIGATSSSSASQMANYAELDKVLRNASMVMGGEKKTVIITTLNDAWAETNSIFDLFVESFAIGNDTKGLLKHLVVICLDDKALARCLASHPHCFRLETKGANFTREASFMSSAYLDMMWRRIQFLGSVLEMGYSFVFTDADIMWLRDPFQRFFQEGDFQIACDYYNGNSHDPHNPPNGGFTYAKSNDRTIKFYKFWYLSRRAYPGLHDQDVLNEIKFSPVIGKIGLKMRFLDTAYFGGFCQPSRDLNLVCTMHANCCVGLNKKINDLTILLQDWRRFTSKQPNINSHSSWSVPQNCSTFFKDMVQKKPRNI
ncbi:uncharacterized protein At4g15970 [Morus notabilis]|uniref:uncharacterized protein At4g15970 n=1 Tax=Morus notabilis TaxID=981085 RepID=UPI000CED2732|nr:uncharacterized protein At4g15970 [Morus notabilis]